MTPIPIYTSTCTGCNTIVGAIRSRDLLHVYEFLGTSPDTTIERTEETEVGVSVCRCEQPLAAAEKGQV